MKDKIKWIKLKAIKWNNEYEEYGVDKLCKKNKSRSEWTSQNLYSLDELQIILFLMNRFVIRLETARKKENRKTLNIYL